MTIILQTERLTLRQWTSRDAEAAFAILGDPEVTRYLGEAGSAFPDLAHTAGWLERIQRAYPTWGVLGSWAAVDTASGLPIGGGGLLELEDGPDVEVFYHFRKASWGHGYATELTRALLAYGFAVTELPRIIGLAYPENIASQRVMTKAGMTHLGRRHAYGADLEYFSISRS
jgi:ribosomal-protein-alanine N-acetyltransferase